MKLSNVILVSSLIGLSLSASAKNDADDYQKWLKKSTSSFHEYKDARDKEFTRFLELQWKEMEVFSGVVRDKTPKPVKMPVAKPLPIKIIPDTVIKPTDDDKPSADKPIIDHKPLPDIVTIPKIVVPKLPLPVKQKPIAKLPAGEHLTFSFYGNPLTFSVDPKYHTQLRGQITSKSISNQWSALSKTNYEQTISQLADYKKPLQTNDWGYALLVNALAQTIYPGSKNEQNMFTWFILLKSGYKARIAFDDTGTYLLFPAKQKIYAAPYFTFNETRYYSLSFDGSEQKLSGVQTYDGDYPNADNLFDMQLSKPLNTKSNSKSRLLSFTYKNKKHNLTVDLDKNVVDFFNTYPQLDINLYFDSEVNQRIGTQLLTQLRPIINGKSEVEAINILLRFVQKSLEYKTDEGQFGKENYLFLEETIFYPYSDCEDRAVMFAWLVRSLLDTEVVGLSYPGHISAAVHIKSNMSGDGFTYNGKRYIVADPTYINANMGQAMPNFKHLKPTVINIKSFKF